MKHCYAQYHQHGLNPIATECVEDIRHYSCKHTMIGGTHANCPYSVMPAPFNKTSSNKEEVPQEAPNKPKPRLYWSYVSETGKWRFEKCENIRGEHFAPEYIDSTPCMHGWGAGLCIKVTSADVTTIEAGYECTAKRVQEIEFLVDVCRRRYDAIKAMRKACDGLWQEIQEFRKKQEEDAEP